jgi:mRNA-degrading endonuclease RelE of RelBE toxin-antitoxin system
MQSKVLWSEQVEAYVRSKAPAPRRELWREVKALASWNGRENPPKIRRLEDKLSGYVRLRVAGHRIIFREDFDGGQRVLKCLYAGTRSSVYESFQEVLLDELAA